MKVDVDRMSDIRDWIHKETEAATNKGMGLLIQNPGAIICRMTDLCDDLEAARTATAEAHAEKCWESEPYRLCSGGAILYGRFRLPGCCDICKIGTVGEVDGPLDADLTNQGP